MINVPDFQSLMLPVLEEASTGEIKIGDVVWTLTAKLNLSVEEAAALLPSGRQTIFANRVHWAKTYLAKAGLVEGTKRGHFRITARGEDVLKSAPAKINIGFLEQFPEFVAFRERSEQAPVMPIGITSDSVSEKTPDEVMRGAHAQIESALAQEMLDRVRSAPPEFFERLIVSLLLAMGYGGSAQDAGRAIGKIGDDGIDGVVDQDALGLDRVYVQAKRYAASNTVGSGAIRDFFGSLDRHKASKGLFVTTSSFSGSARETADYLSKRIVLIDGDLLAKLMIRHNVGCRIEETLHLKRLDEDFFE
jgi:restriction system protein